MIVRYLALIIVKHTAATFEYVKFYIVGWSVTIDFSFIYFYKWFYLPVALGL